MTERRTAADVPAPGARPFLGARPRGARPQGRHEARPVAPAELDSLLTQDDSARSLWIRRLSISVGVLSITLALAIIAEFVTEVASPVDWAIVAIVITIAILSIVTIRLVDLRDREYEAELADTARLIRGLSRAVSPDAVVEAIADEVGAATAADHVVLVRRRPRAWALDATLVSVGTDVAPSSTTLPSTDLMPSAPGSEPSVRRLESRVADAFGLRNTVAAPLVVESGLIGALVLSRRTGTPWGDGARRRLAIAAGEASAALDRAYTLSDAEARALTDPLTGLPNRRRLDEHIRDLTGRRRAGDRVGVLMLDLDHFKRLNDDLGHPAGDRVLVAVGRAIAATVRDVDLPARVGGEEFAVILRDPGAAPDVAERLRVAISSIDLSAHGIGQVTVSIGVAVAHDAREPIPDVIARADDALLRAKRAGRDRVEIG